MNVPVEVNVISPPPPGSLLVRDISRCIMVSASDLKVHGLPILCVSLLTCSSAVMVRKLFRHVSQAGSLKIELQAF
jgi:hypothetical protein